jgi:predicted Ser/Thr protein kinase
MLSDEGEVYLIDFDRADFRSVTENLSSVTWCLSNLDRLQRSLKKEAKQRLASAKGSQSPESSGMSGFEILKSSWKNSLS